MGGPRVVIVRFRWLPVSVVKGRGGQGGWVGVWGVGVFGRGRGGFEGWKVLVFENGDGKGGLLLLLWLLLLLSGRL